jgi:iron complex outermembrane recepter protein
MLSYNIPGMSEHRTSPAAFAAALVLAAGSPAFAQNLPDPAQDEIVVTATALGDRSVDALQGNVTLDRGDVIESLGDGLGETLEAQPGLASTFFGGGACRPIIRGLG